MKNEVHSNKFPYVVVRLMAAAYSVRQIEFDNTITVASFGPNAKLHVPPYKAEIAISETLYLIDVLISLVRHTKHRMCLVVSEDESYYVEIDGSVTRSTSRPSGGVILN